MNAETYNLELKQFSGYTKSNKILREIRKFLFDFRDPNAHPLSCQEKAFVYGTDKDNQILEIGGSHPKDLYTNNFGHIMAGLCFGGISNSTVNPQDYKDETNTTRTIVTRSGNALNNGSMTSQARGIAVQKGTSIRFGNGIANPEKTDFELTTPFLNSPESLHQPTNSSLPPFNSGLGSYNLSTQIIGVSETITIREIGLFEETSDDTTNPVLLFILLYAHDLVTPTVQVNSGNNINGEYVMSVGT